MKKLFLAVVLLISTQAAFSQAFSKKIESSDNSIQDPKKMEQPKTWIARAQLFQDIAEAPIKGLWAGMSEMEYNLLSAELGKATSTATETIGGQQYDVKVYDDKKVFFDVNKVVAFWDITSYATPNPLKKAYEAYEQAIKLDVDKKNSKKIAAGLERLSGQAKNQGSNDFQMGRMKEALDNFALSLDCSSDPLIGKSDSVILYYAGVIASDLKEYDKAEKYFRKAIEINYVKDGDVFSHLGQILLNEQKQEDALKVLQEGLTKHPENQDIIISLINAYMTVGRDPKEILPLLHQAQKAQPQNASLYFAEAQLYEKTNDMAKAAEFYTKSTEIDAKYFYGYYALGILLFNQGVKFQDDANGVDLSNNAEYERLMALSNEYFEKALNPFLKAYELNKTEKSVLQALKDIYFRFRSKSPEFEANATKFKELYDNAE